MTQREHITVVTAALASLLLFLVVALLAEAEHTLELSWMRAYKGADNLGCCSELDCRPVPVTLVGQGRDTVTVLVRETLLVLPAQSVHLSQDHNTYWCYRGAMEPPVPTVENTRCAFLSVGS